MVTVRIYKPTSPPQLQALVNHQIHKKRRINKLEEIFPKMLFTRTLLPLAVLVVGAIAQAAPEPSDPTNIDPVPEVDSADIVGRDANADPETGVFKRKPCKCRKVRHSTTLLYI